MTLPAVKARGTGASRQASEASAGVGGVATRRGRGALRASDRRERKTEDRGSVDVAGGEGAGHGSESPSERSECGRCEGEDGVAAVIQARVLRKKGGPTQRMVQDQSA